MGSGGSPRLTVSEWELAAALSLEAECGLRDRAPESGVSLSAGCPGSLPTWAELGCDAGSLGRARLGWLRIRCARTAALHCPCPSGGAWTSSPASPAAGHGSRRRRCVRGLEGPQRGAEVERRVWVRGPGRTRGRAASLARERSTCLKRCGGNHCPTPRHPRLCRLFYLHWRDNASS